MDALKGGDVVRYFLAVTPPGDLQDHIETFRGRWNHPHHKVEPHITVKIPFEWAASAAPFLQAARTACAGIAPFELELGSPDWFASGRVLFLSVDRRHLLPLHEAVIQALEPMVSVQAGGHEGGDRYHPHLTLASTKFGISDAALAAMAAEASKELAALGAFQVTHLRCYRWGQGDRRWIPYQDLPLGPGV